MAFDGSVIACITDELNRKITGGRIVKIAQPEKDSLLLTVKKDAVQLRLLISADPSLPMIYITEKNLASPAQAPAFCMLLRKHLNNAKILEISQPSLERIINFRLEHYNEMGDLCRKTLTVELMGKHSNIIFLEDDRILDSIKHVSGAMSSVREVLPGRQYFIPFEGDKQDPLKITEEAFMSEIFSDNKPLSKAIYSNLTGISPILAEEIAYRASGIESDRPANTFSDDQKTRIWNSFRQIMTIIEKGLFEPNIAYDNSEPVFYGPFRFKLYSDHRTESYDSISALLYDYYSQKQTITVMRQKTSALRQIVQGMLNKDYKKYDLQLKQIKDTQKKDKYKLYGELITAYGYSVEPKATSMKAVDYNTDEEITIPLDPTMSAIENGKKYFNKYAKLKRTEEALADIVEQTKAEIEHLESIQTALEIVSDQADIAEIRKEMADSGYIRSRYVQSNKKNNSKGGKKAKEKSLKSSPLHYVSSDGFDIYVGKNNYQNEYISFKLAEGNDWWFHAKKIPGSHVIVKSKGMEVPDSTFEEAAALAAYYSKAHSQAGSNSQARVEIDYIQKKFLKKTPGGKPGFVIYHTNFSMSVTPDISRLTLLE